jgi:hypothetical protein
MTDDGSLERAARSWLEAGPTKAPDQAVEAALLRIGSTIQERGLRTPWRFVNMTTPARIAVLVTVGTLVLAGGLALFGGGSAPAPVPTAAPTEVLTSPRTVTLTSRPTVVTPPAQIIPDGIYAGTALKVDAILDQLAGNPSLGAAEKEAIIDSLLGIRGATTYQTRVAIHGSSMTVDQVVDGVSHPESWTIRPLDGKRIAAMWSGGTIEFEIRGCGLPGSSCGFTFQAMTPAPSAVEAFVRKLLFEQSGPFVPQS